MQPWHVTIVAVMVGGPPPGARADGDPASDVLLSQSLFLPQDAGVPATDQTQLASLLAAAHRADYNLRVALIAGPADLGSVTALWRQPRNYARFLGQELSLNYTGALLVVMPDGYGFYRPRGASASEQSVLNQLTPPGHEARNRRAERHPTPCRRGRSQPAGPNRDDPTTAAAPTRSRGSCSRSASSSSSSRGRRACAPARHDSSAAESPPASRPTRRSSPSTRV